MRWPDAVLWDFDGVIADTGELHFQTWAKVLTGEGLAFSREMFIRGFGMVNAEAIPFWFGRAVPAARMADISARKEALFLQEARGRGPLLLLPGVKDWLSRLRSRGIMQAVASSAPLANLVALTEALGIARFFHSIVSAEHMPGKPDPAVFLEAARRLGARPGSCVVIEDSLHGVEAAVRAGMKCIAVTTTHPASALGRADLVLDSLESLTPEALQGLF